MGTTLLRELPTAVQQLVKTDATLLAVLATLAIVALLVHFRDGRAIGTKARPDLHTVPGKHRSTVSRWTGLTHCRRQVCRFWEICST